MQLVVLQGKLNRDQVVQRLHDEIDRQKHHGIQYWPLFETKSGQFIGCSGLRPCTFTPGDSLGEKNYELGYHIIKQCWGKGYATEAAKGAIKYAHEKLGLTKLYAGHHPHNANSKKVLLKLGFRHMEDTFYEATGLQHPSYILNLIS
jgi:RimJ/RimL family protein N-acetyltransferase